MPESQSVVNKESPVGRILVIDDHSGFAEYMRRVLTRNRFEVSSAASGEQALEKIASGRYDLILLDWHLSGFLSGQQVLRLLREQPQTKGIPVIVISGLQMERATIESILSAGATCFVSKSELGDKTAEFILKIRQVLRGELAGFGHVLVVEDDEGWQEFVKGVLERKASRLSFAGTGQKGIELARSQKPDAILLDLTLPGLNGVEVFSRLRDDEGTKDIPILIMTAMKDSSGAFKSATRRFGADDFLYKPFSAEELIARLDHIARKGALNSAGPARGAAQQVLTVGALSLDSGSRSVIIEGKTLRDLTAKELELLLYLMRNSHRIVPWAELERKIWNVPRHLRTDGHASEKIRVHVASLKRKIGRISKAAAAKLITHRRIGLQFLP